MQNFRMDTNTQKKILTANNLMKRGWTDDPICKLCANDQETATHLCKDCPFTKEVWELIKVWFGLTDLSSINTSARSIITGEDAEEKLTKIREDILMGS